jgi:hypothetical protein
VYPPLRRGAARRGGEKTPIQPPRSPRQSWNGAELKRRQWLEFADAVPSHWLDDLSTVAGQASEERRDFAEHLRSRQAEAV